MSIKAIQLNDESVRAIIAKKKTQLRIVNKKAVDMMTQGRGHDRARILMDGS